MKKKLPVKLILFLGLLLIALIIGTSVTYILEYNKNIPVLFDEEIKATKFDDIKSSKYFDITLRSVVYSPKKENSTANGSMEIDATVFLKESVNPNSISNVKLQYSTGCNWGKCTDKSSNRTVTSSYYIQDESKEISKQTVSFQLSLTTVMPIKSLLFINVKRPDIFIKLSYNYKTDTDDQIEMVEYFKVKASQWKNIYSENY